MAELFTLEVATPRGVALRMECDWVTAPSVDGEFGVLAGHLPLLAALKCGVLKVHTEGKEQVMAIGPGFVSAQPHKMEILSDLFALPKHVNLDAVNKELVEAEKAVAAFGKAPEGAEYQELVRDVEWARARIDMIAESEK